MNYFSSKSRQEPEISATAPDSDVPLWLLQKDETRFLYVSLFLSVTVHIALFTVMAATHIFHPFTGSTQEFDLVWFSPAGITIAPKQVITNTSEMNKIAGKITQKTTAAKYIPAVIPQAKTVPEPPLPSNTLSSPPHPTPKAAPAAVEAQNAQEAPIEEPAEMTISRFSGKVVEVVNKKAENPTFNVISSVKMKSKNARTAVQSIRETEVAPKKARKSRSNSNQSEDTAASIQPMKKQPGKQLDKVALATSSANQSKVSQQTVQENAIQRKVSSVATTPAGNKTVTLPAVNRSINSFAAALDTLAAAGNKQTAQTQAPQMQA